MSDEQKPEDPPPFPPTWTDEDIKWWLEHSW